MKNQWNKELILWENQQDRQTLFKLTKGQRENTQINKVRNEKGEITTDAEEIQRIIMSYFENLYSTKYENLKEMDNFLYRYLIPKLNQAR